MRLSDIRLLLSLVAVAGVGFIPLLVIESRNSDETYGRLLRPVLFGYIHPILPASILLGSATLVFFSWMLTHCRRNGIQHRGAGWNGLVAIGGLLTTLTYVAVRSALLATIGMTIVAAAATVWIPFRRRVTLLAYVFAVTSACMLMFSYQIPYYAKLSQAVGS